MGLIGAGGVHSSINHLYALINLAKQKNFKRLYLHLFTDGRDSPPSAALTYINELRNVIKKEGIGQIASLTGRYWAMDRDKRWDRTQKAYDALVKGVGNIYKTPEEILETHYAEGKLDEFIEPSLISDNKGEPIATIKDNDAVIFFNFRIDRPRQLSSLFVLDDISQTKEGFGFDPYQVEYTKKHEEDEKIEAPVTKRDGKLKNLLFVTMTEYSKILTESGAKVAFPPEIVSVCLGSVISEKGLTQLRMAESEKERFVTFYFNGQQESEFIGERRIIIPSPKIATYDKKPDMSARELTDTLIKEIQGPSKYSFILLNFANADMVGHTGSIGATVKACEVLDECLGKIANTVLAYDGCLLITGDHGNAEEMIDSQTGTIETEHSSNPVPFIAIAKKFMGKATNLQQGILGDIAPTILNLLKIEVPTSSMTGRNLITD
jgi:2,3-bisphosphoglycerate-independent phosphoglycerate mutase